MEKRKALVVVDYQKDFVDGALGFESAKNLDEGIASLVQEYMDNDDIVIYTADTHHPDYMDTQEGRKLPVEHCIDGTDGWKFYGKTGEAYDKYYPKGKMHLCKKSTFGSELLIKLLDSYNKSLRNEHIENCVEPTREDWNANLIESITLVGVVTNMCVISNAVIAKAACPEAEIIIKKDLVDSFDKELHQKALDVMASMQMTVE